MKVTRLANAEWAASNGRPSMRYVVVCNVHEGIDPNEPIRILDSVGTERFLYVSDLLLRLSEEARKHFLYS
uniref:Uncharacterized protein n=1 Tax=Leviviridae sp. TaxID=2027243 RepID=A0A514D4L0_9VIRU|nr:MAG: hypothetical protein H3BulkLitter173043_000002 [Leviviridae sp.]